MRPRKIDEEQMFALLREGKQQKEIAQIVEDHGISPL